MECVNETELLQARFFDDELWAVSSVSLGGMDDPSLRGVYTEKCLGRHIRTWSSKDSSTVRKN